MSRIKFLTSFSTLKDYGIYVKGKRNPVPNVSWVDDIAKVKYNHIDSIVCIYDVDGDSPTLIKLMNTIEGVRMMRVDGGVFRDPQVGWTFQPGKHIVEIILTEPNHFKTALFKDCVNLQSVYIDSPVESISKNGFYGCTSLTKVVMPDSIKVINSNAFSYCYSLGDITIPRNLEKIGPNAFQNTSITEFEVPETVMEIGTSAFVNCDNLASVTFKGNNVAYIGQQAFQNCVSLEEIIFPSSVYTYGKLALMGCCNLRTVDFGESVTSFGDRVIANTNITSMRGNVVTEDGDAIVVNSALCAVAPHTQVIEIPTDVQCVKPYAMGYCHDLVCVTITHNVTELCGNAFYRCDALETINSRTEKAPGIQWTTFNQVREEGELHHYVGVDYSKWMSEDEHYLGYYSWTDATKDVEMVDLGLPSGLLWAKTNIGAESITDIGNYFKFGEVVGHSSDECTHFDTSVPEIEVDGNNRLLPSYDAATVAYGPSYHMPSNVDMRELLDNTYHEEMVVDNVRGMRYYKKDDPDTYIFIPYSYYCANGAFYNDGLDMTFIWSNSLINETNAYVLGNHYIQEYFRRFLGLSIRAVQETPITYEFVDLGLPSGTMWAKTNLGARRETQYGKYFQWGETEGYMGDEATSHSTWDTISVNGGYEEFNQEYFELIQDGICPNGILGPTYDAVTQALGDDYSMPTQVEILELIANTDNEVITINGVEGMKFTNREDASKYIFIPFAGFYNDGYFYGENGFLWSSSIYKGYDIKNGGLLADSDSGIYDDDEVQGCCYSGPIRPIKRKVYEFVDLGLPSGSLWAKTNLGAFEETDYGRYYQWGDTVGYTGDAAKAHSNWSTAPFNGGNEEFDQDYFDSVKDAVCPNGILAPEYDAVTQMLGDGYSMPTLNDIQELVRNTNQEVVEINGVRGMKFTNRSDASKYIFLPLAGGYWGGNFRYEGSNIFLWSSSLFTDGDDESYGLWANSNGLRNGRSNDRYYSFPIRPFKRKTYEYVDLGLPSGLKWAKTNIGAEKESDYGRYFQWGDTVGYTGDEAKAHSGWVTAPFNGGNSSFNQSYFNGVKDTVCPNGVLAPEYDAAHLLMGGDWRMPTLKDIQELVNRTNHEVAEIDGVRGMKFINRSDASKYIFVPFAGDCWGGGFYYEGNSGRLWGSSLYAGNDDRAYYLWADSDGYCNGSYYSRNDSFPVRGVLE